MAATIKVIDLATALNTDPRTTRKFLRSITPKDNQPGKGGQWVIDGAAASMKSLRKQFDAYAAARTPDTEVADAE
jgi:hypothetical protein